MSKRQVLSVIHHGITALFLLCVLLPASSVKADDEYVMAPALGGSQSTFGVPQGGKVTQPYTVQEIACTGTSNVFWPGEKVGFTLQFVNNTNKPLNATGQAIVISYGTSTSTDPDNQFGVSSYKKSEICSIPITIALDANGYQNIDVAPEMPHTFGPYALVVDMTGLGRQLAACFVLTPKSTPGKEQFPTFALDIMDWYNYEPTWALFQRLGIKATRMEWSYNVTDTPECQQNWSRLQQVLQGMAKYDITPMLTINCGNVPQPLPPPRRFLDDNGHQRIMDMGDRVWMPQYDDDFKVWCERVAGTFGWPKGPVNGMELWNEPWEGISISGWGADIIRYRDIFSHMATGIETARQKTGVQVLIGGTCSSMNTEDKLFCDGNDTFLKWLDFTSIHYQPMNAMPSVNKLFTTRQSPYGPVRVWDTESWMANSEDRVAGMIASMRSVGQSRTAGVLHDATYSLHTAQLHTPQGVSTIRVAQVYPTAAAIATVQLYIGQRNFKEILFKNGLPWVYEFEGLPKKDGDKLVPDEDDSTLVIVGDLGMIYPWRDLLYHRTITGMANAPKVAAIRAQMQALPADASAAQRDALRKALLQAMYLENASMTLPDGKGHFILYDYFGNPVPSKNGKITVPLDGHGYILRTDGSAGSFAKLTDAVRNSRIDGYEPVEIAAHDMQQPIAQHPTMQVSITNILNRPITGKLSIDFGALTVDTPEQTLTIAGNETKNITLKITGGDAQASNIYPLTVTFDAGADGKKSLQEDMHANVIAKRAITVDGKLEDWKDVLPMIVHTDVQRTSNFTESAWYPWMTFSDKVSSGMTTSYLACDDQYFYFAAKIADSTPWEGGVRYAKRDDDSYFYPAVSYDQSGKKLEWPSNVRRYSYRKDADMPSGDNTDNVQIGFNVIPEDQKAYDPFPPGTMPHYMSWLDTDYEYALNPVAQKYGGGTEIWRLLAPGTPRKHYFPRQPKADIDGGPVDNGKLSITRDGNTRIVECALPWSEIPEVKKCLDAGQPIKFNYRVNDNNGPAYEMTINRSVAQLNHNTFHNYWVQHWSNEVDFTLEK